MSEDKPRNPLKEALEHIAQSKELIGKACLDAGPKADLREVVNGLSHLTDIVWPDVDGARPTAAVVWEDSAVAEKILRYLSRFNVEDVCEEFVSRPGAGSCRRCGYSESLHLLRDAYRALRKLTLITVAQEPAGAGDDLTVTIHKAGK